MDTEFFDDRKTIVERLKKYAKKFNFTVFAKPLYINFGDILYAYSDEQKKYITKASYMHGDKHNHIPSRKMQKYTTIDWKMVLNKGNLLLEKENSWFGWKCNIWLNLLIIKFDGSVLRWRCQVWWKLWNIFTTYTLPSNGVICAKEKCSCLSDIMVPKYFGTN